MNENQVIISMEEYNTLKSYMVTVLNDDKYVWETVWSVCPPTYRLLTKDEVFKQLTDLNSELADKLEKFKLEKKKPFWKKLF